MTANANAETDASTAGAAAGEHRQAGMDAHTVHDAQFDARDARVADFDKDTGADERVEATGPDNWDIGYLNKKRTYDLYQTLDTDSILYNRRQEMMESERRRIWDDREQQQRMRFAEAEMNQRLRHADFQVSALAAITKEMVDTIADRTADKVCARLSK